MGCQWNCRRQLDPRNNRRERALYAPSVTPRTEHTIIDRRKLFAEFEESRHTGIAADREESIRGGICFGAALRNDSKPVVAAISISTPTTRKTPEMESSIKAALLESADRIARLLEKS